MTFYEFYMALNPPQPYTRRPTSDDMMARENQTAAFARKNAYLAIFMAGLIAGIVLGAVVVILGQ